MSTSEIIEAVQEGASALGDTLPVLVETYQRAILYTQDVCQNTISTIASKPNESDRNQDVANILRNRFSEMENICTRNPHTAPVDEQSVGYSITQMATFASDEHIRKIKFLFANFVNINSLSEECIFHIITTLQSDIDHHQKFFSVSAVVEASFPVLFVESVYRRSVYNKGS